MEFIIVRGGALSRAEGIMNGTWDSKETQRKYEGNTKEIQRKYEGNTKEI